MEHHSLDSFPIPKDEKPLYLNEPWLIDRSLEWIMQERVFEEPLPDEDNIRVYFRWTYQRHLFCEDSIG